MNTIQEIKDLIQESNSHNQILKILKSLKLKNKELTEYNGFGYCGYGSKILSLELNKNNISNSILIGTYFDNTPEGIKCKNNVHELILTFLDNENNIFSDIKKHFTRRGNKLPDRTGHVVVLVNDKIYDITSEQFGLSTVYSLGLFKSIWKSIKIADLTIDKNSDFYINGDIKTIKTIQ